MSQPWMIGGGLALCCTLMKDAAGQRQTNHFDLPSDL